MERTENTKRLIAYFSMEIGIDSGIPTYSGGLGILAGDTIKSCADLKVPMVAVTLLYKKGQFYQKIDDSGKQNEQPHEWNYRKMLTPLQARACVELRGKPVYIKAWQYLVKSNNGFFIPVIFLDTDITENDVNDRSITHVLYGGDDNYRLMQESILGIGGVRMLEELGYRSIKKYHMNEGHSSLLAVELLKSAAEKTGLTPGENFNELKNRIKQMCIFTTHTPVPAGHDQFSYEQVKIHLGDYFNIELLKELGGKDKLNMTLIALNLSDYINGVAKEHGKISRGMFPGYPVDSITNGVHSYSWTSRSFKELYDKFIPEWNSDPFNFRYAINIPAEHIWECHQKEKSRLISYINRNTGSGFKNDVFTIGFARRSTAYKRPDLIFHDIKRLINISDTKGKIQLVFSGKAHPRDCQGKELIKKIIVLSREVKDKLKVVFLENYDMGLAAKIVSGVDLWLNTPKKPNEASGTSGMKAAHNGVPSLSTLDGWWIEGHIEGITGWAIGTSGSAENSDQDDAESLYDKLENVIVDKFYKDHEEWVKIMRYTIAINASFFNSHRMVWQYIANAYAY